MTQDFDLSKLSEAEKDELLALLASREAQNGMTVVVEHIADKGSHNTCQRYLYEDAKDHRLRVFTMIHLGKALRPDDPTEIRRFIDATPIDGQIYEPADIPFAGKVQLQRRSRPNPIEYVSPEGRAIRERQEEYEKHTKLGPRSEPSPTKRQTIRGTDGKDYEVM